MGGERGDRNCFNREYHPRRLSPPLTLHRRFSTNRKWQEVGRKPWEPHLPPWLKRWHAGWIQFEDICKNEREMDCGTAGVPALDFLLFLSKALKSY